VHVVLADLCLLKVLENFEVLGNFRLLLKTLHVRDHFIIRV